MYCLREFLSISDISNSNLDYGLYLIKKDLFKINRILFIFDFSTSVYD